MSAWLPELEGWAKALGAFVAVVMAVLVPIRSWIVEDRRYRERMLEAAVARPPADPAEPDIAALAAEIARLADALRETCDLLRAARCRDLT